jgi:hypothetical protein
VFYMQTRSVKICIAIFSTLCLLCLSICLSVCVCVCVEIDVLNLTYSEKPRMVSTVEQDVEDDDGEVIDMHKGPEGEGADDSGDDDDSDDVTEIANDRSLRSAYVGRGNVQAVREARNRAGLNAAFPKCDPLLVNFSEFMRSAGASDKDIANKASVSSKHFALFQMSE